MAPRIADLIASTNTDIKAVLTRARAAGRTELTLVEDAEVAGLEKRRAELVKIRDQEAETDRLLAQTRPTNYGGQAYDRTFRVSGERRTYEPPAVAHQRDGRSTDSPRFLSDVIGAFRGDYSAAQRLARHQDEERAERGTRFETRAAGDAGTGAFSGLVVPQYLTDMYAPKARAMRPFAENCNHHDLPPEGMEVRISQITTGTTAALQATELATVSGTSIDDTLLACPVQTAAGYQDVSRQAIERGTNVEEVVMADLFAAHASVLDSTLINQATTGLAAVSTLNTYTNAVVDTTAIPATWKQIIAAQNGVEAVLLGRAPVSMIVMHNRRWNWLTAAISASWPVIAGTNGVPPMSWGMQLTNEYGPSVRGVTASGLKIVVDANVTTIGLAQAVTGGTQDHIYVVAGDECHLWEDPAAPFMIRAEQPRAKDLAVTLVVYSYFAATFARYAGGSAVISGTGTATPSFA